ncbi:MAG: hypothetical protein M3N11_05450 [Actinomycetota bacterium]|nr:hypothetical protein [Actinomycetota bacterium]
MLGGLVITAFGLLARFAPGALTSATRHGLEASAQSRFPFAESPEAALALALLWIQGPALLVLFSSMPVSNFAAALSTAEVSEGKAEYLLAWGFSPRQIALATMLTVCTRSLFVYLCMAAAWLTSAAALSWLVLSADLDTLPWRDSLTFTLCGALLALWTSSVVSLSSVRWPTVSSARFGSATGISTLGALPGLLVLAAMTLIAGDDLRRVVVTLSGLSILVMMAAVAWLTRGLTRSALL